MTPQDGLPKKGELLAGKYQVEEVLGAGGMGVVVAARHVALRQRVALKFLRPAATNLPGATARFLREAQAAAAIQSEHVARVLDVGTLETGAPYMVMEHLSGVDLARHLATTGPLAIEDAVDFVLQASEVLAEAHGLGIVHRDLKPANIFLARRPEGSPLIKVLDFGLSKMAVTDDAPPGTSLTAANVVAGSPHYMSPEQVRSLKYVDARTDVWALGVILYELLTGKRPFEGHTVTAVCAAVVADTPPPARSHRPDLPAPLDALLMACLEKDAHRRVPSVAHLAAALAPFAPKRSEPSIDRISRLQSATTTPANPVDFPKTIPWLAGPPQAAATPGTPAPPPPPAPARPGDTQPLPIGAVRGVLPDTPVDGSPSAKRGELAESSGAPVPLTPVVPGTTGPVSWGNTQSPATHRRGTLVVVGAGLGLVVVALLVGFVALRNGEEPTNGSGAVALATTPPAGPAQSSSAPRSSASQMPAPPSAPATAPAGPSATASTPGSATRTSSSLLVPTAAPAVKSGSTATAVPRLPSPPTANPSPPVVPTMAPPPAKKPNPLDIKD